MLTNQEYIKEDDSGAKLSDANVTGNTEGGSEEFQESTVSVGNMGFE